MIMCTKTSYREEAIREQRRARKMRELVRMKLSDLDFIEESCWIREGGFARLTLDLDVRGFEVFLTIQRLKSRGILVYECDISPRRHGYHIVAFIRQKSYSYDVENNRDDELRTLRTFFGDDPLRIELDERRPSYARQVLFGKKSNRVLRK